LDCLSLAVGSQSHKHPAAFDFRGVRRLKKLRLTAVFAAGGWSIHLTFQSNSFSAGVYPFGHQAFFLSFGRRCKLDAVAKLRKQVDCQE